MGKFLWASRLIRNKKIVMLWSGSDVLFARDQLASTTMDAWIASKIHWAVSPALAEEVRALGLRCEPVHASFVKAVAQPKPPPRQFSVLLYVPSRERAMLYGWDVALEIARALPAVQFDVVGLATGEMLDPLPNVKFHPWVKDLSPFIERATVVWRPVRHDAGTSFMILEALAQGRHALYTYSHPGCIHASDVTTARREIETLRARHDAGTLGLNSAGMEYINRHCSLEKVRGEILRRWKDIVTSPAIVPKPPISHHTASAGRSAVRFPGNAD